MSSRPLTIAQCAAFSGLDPEEMILGVTPSAVHHSLYASYLMRLRVDPSAVRDMIVADIRAFLDLGALKPAADRLIALRWLLSDHPGARLSGRPRKRKKIAVPAPRKCADVIEFDARLQRAALKKGRTDLVGETRDPQSARSRLSRMRFSSCEG